MKRIYHGLLVMAISLATLYAPSAMAALDHIGLHGELVQVHGPMFATNPTDTKPGMLIGPLFSFNSIVELRPQIVMSQGQYRALVVDAGLKINPDILGFDEYLLGLFSPYVALGAGVSVPLNVGYYAKLGLSVNVMDRFLANVEIGYRGQRLDQNFSIDNSPSLAVRIGMFL